MEDNFWADELVYEFSFKEYGRSSWDAMQKFKESKQQAVSKDWLIESYEYRGTIWSLYKENEYYDENGKFDNNAASDAKIKSVRRLSDGEVFAISDEIGDSERYFYKNKIIGSFAIDNDKMYVILKDNVGLLPLKDVVKKKKLLFTTEDGKDIYEGDKVALLGTNYWGISFPVSAPATPFFGHENEFKYFSTKEAAEAFILMNKPCLSLNDVISKYGFIYGNKLTVHISEFNDALKELVKSKLNQ